MSQLFDLRNLLSVYVQLNIWRPATLDSYADAIKNLESCTGAMVALESITVPFFQAAGCYLIWFNKAGMPNSTN